MKVLEEKNLWVQGLTIMRFYVRYKHAVTQAKPHRNPLETRGSFFRAPFRIFFRPLGSLKEDSREQIVVRRLEHSTKD